MPGFMSYFLLGSLQKPCLPNESVRDSLKCLELQNTNVESLLKQQTIFTTASLFCSLRKISG